MYSENPTIVTNCVSANRWAPRCNHFVSFVCWDHHQLLKAVLAQHLQDHIKWRKMEFNNLKLKIFCIRFVGGWFFGKREAAVVSRDLLLGNIRSDCNSFTLHWNLVDEMIVWNIIKVVRF